MSSPVSKPPLRVLFVEDSIDDVVLMLRELERSYTVTAERVEARQAMGDALTASTWDVIICDYSMPRFSATDALASLRELACEVPCIVVSGTIGEDTAVQTIQAGAYDYLLKDRLARLAPAVERALRDSTARRALKLAGAERRRMQQMFAEAERLAHIGSWEWDEATNTMIWSDEMYRVFGYEPRTPAVISYELFLERIPPDDRAVVRDTIERIARERRPLECEHRVVTPDGAERTIHLRGAARTDPPEPGGFMVRIIGSAQDVSERRQAEAALELSEAQLRQSQKMEAIGQLAGGIAHDFNNLLTAILGYSELLLGELPEGAQRRDVEDIRRAAESAAALTRQLLAFSRKQILQPRRLALNQVVSQIQTLLRRIIGEDIELTAELDPELMDVEADETQIVQVVMNLAVNARDAMPRGGRLLVRTANLGVSPGTARRHPGLKPGPYVALSVSDTGVGMTPEVRARLFEPFFTTKEQGKGTGLGLSTVYGIVKQSGGYIMVESEPGAGSTFTILLPRAEARAPAAAPPPAAPGVTAGVSGRRTILLVEDDPPLRRLASRVLEHLGYDVLVAGDGSQALELCRTHPGRIDLVVTDVVMPEMGGRELASWLARVRPGTQVLFMSGYTDDAMIRHGLTTPGVAFLSKPFAPESLVRAVRNLLEPGEAAPHRDATPDASSVE